MRRWSALGSLLLVVVVAACGSETPSPSGGATRSTAPAPSGGPEITPEPTPIAAGAGADAVFDPIVLKGKGDKTIAFEIPDDAVGLAALSHPGRGVFEVHAVDETGADTQTLVKVSGKYKGVVLFDLVDHSAGFKVHAKGPWVITVQPIASAAAWDGTSTLKGKGDTMVRLTTPSADGATVAMRSTGKSRFTLRAHSADDDVQLFSGVGPVKGQVKLPAETTLIEIRAGGAWSIAPGS